MKNYFLETPVSQWCMKSAFEIIERESPSSEARLNLRTLYEMLSQVLISSDEERISEVVKYLQNWKDIRKELIPKREKETERASGSNSMSLIFTNSNNNNITIHQNELPNNSTAHCSSSGSGSGTWNTQERPSKKRKYLSTYLGSFYSNADLGNYSNWVINDVNITNALRKFRQMSIEGAQMRRYLSNSRILSLSYIFLLSDITNCVISKLHPNDQKTIMTFVKNQNPVQPINLDVTLACHEVHTVLTNHLLDRNEVEDALDDIKSSFKGNNEVRVLLRITYDFLTKFLHNNKSNHRPQGEASMIIDNIKPYIIHCIVSDIPSIKYEWLTYHFSVEGCQLFIPDAVLYLEDLGPESLELFFIEAKRKGNYHNNNLEDDIVKLGKEMQNALNKLIKRRVLDPEIVGLLVNDDEAVTYKMDLKYDGQYRMMEIGRFHIARNTNDVLLMPVILENMKQICLIVNKTAQKLYQAANDDDENELFIRKQCDNPVMVNCDSIKKRKK